MKRADYMSGAISHEEYYGRIAEMAHIKFNPDDEFINRVRRALVNGDEHLNTIRLTIWDAKAWSAKRAIQTAMKQIEGEFWSMAGGVCVMKAAARRAALASN